MDHLSGVMFGGAHRRRPKKILFVINTPISATDTVLQGILQNNVGSHVNGNANNSVTTIDDSAAASTSLVGYDLIVVSESVTSATVGTTFLNVPIPFITNESALIDDMEMSPNPGSTFSTDTDFTIADTSRLGPYTGDVGVYTVASDIYYIPVADVLPSAITLATVPGFPANCAVMFEAGSTRDDGGSFASRRAFIGYTTGTLTATGQDIFKIVCELLLFLR